MLQTFSLSKRYRNINALNELTCEVRPGEIVGLLGPNGAGKTTTLRCMAGILRPSSGAVIVNGFDTRTEDAQAKMGLAYIPEVPTLYELLTVEEHLKFVAMCFNAVETYKAMKEDVLSRYHLWDKRHELVATLSKGMRQKLSIACALVHHANVYLFDEPLIGIDPSGVHEFNEELVSLRAKGASILISTHLLDTAEKMCDRMIILSKGQIRAQGTVNELRAMYGREGDNLEQIFLSLTEGQADAVAM